LIANPPSVRSEPPDRLALTPQRPTGTYKATGTRAGLEWVRFVEPQTDTHGIIVVSVLSTSLFWALALGGGLIGGLVVRESAISAWRIGSASRPENLKLVLGLLTSVLAGWGAHAAMLAGWLERLRITELNYSSAGFIGVIGGVAGISVFELFAGR